MNIFIFHFLHPVILRLKTAKEYDAGRHGTKHEQINNKMRTRSVKRLIERDVVARAGLESMIPVFDLTNSALV